MANRFWVGGAGTWDATTTHWSFTSGGAGGASVPGTSDTAVFDANSTGGDIRYASSTLVGGLDMSDYTGVAKFWPALSTDGILTVQGNVALSASMDYFTGVTLFLTGTGAQTYTSNGSTFGGPVAVNAPGGTYTLQDNLTGISLLTLTAGTFNAGAHAVTIPKFNSSGTSTRVLTGSGAWTLSFGAAVWDCSTATGLTFTSFTASIKLTSSGGGPTFAGGGKTYGNFWYAPGAGAAGLIITGANTFADLEDDGSVAHQITLPASTTTTISTLTVSGSAGALISLRSSTRGTKATLSCASGTISRDYLDIKDSAATGGATWNPGVHSVNSGDNTGWLFPAGYSFCSIMG